MFRFLIMMTSSWLGGISLLSLVSQFPVWNFKFSFIKLQIKFTWLFKL